MLLMHSYTLKMKITTIRNITIDLLLIKHRKTIANILRTKIEGATRGDHCMKESTTIICFLIHDLSKRQ